MRPGIVLLAIAAAMACNTDNDEPVGSARIAPGSERSASLARIDALGIADIQTLGRDALLDLIVSVADPADQERLRVQVRDAVMQGGQLRSISASANYDQLVARFQSLSRAARLGKAARPYVLALAENAGPQDDTAVLLRGAAESTDDVLVLPASCTPEQLYAAVSLHSEGPSKSPGRRSIFPNLTHHGRRLGPTPADFVVLLESLRKAPRTEIGDIGAVRTLRVGA